MWPLPFALMILGGVSAAAGRRLIAATALVLLVDWAACASVIAATGDFYPVLFFMVADYAAGMAIFMLRRSHWQSAIMAIYAMQLVCHAAYALSGMGEAATYYSYWLLTYMAWGQVALIGGWIGTDIVGRRLSISRGRPHQAGDVAGVAREAP